MNSPWWYAGVGIWVLCECECGMHRGFYPVHGWIWVTYALYYTYIIDYMIYVV